MAAVAGRVGCETIDCNAAVSRDRAGDQDQGARHIPHEGDFAALDSLNNYCTIAFPAIGCRMAHVDMKGAENGCSASTSYVHSGMEVALAPQLE